MVKPEGEVFIDTFVEHAELERELGMATKELENVNRFISGDAQPRRGLLLTSTVEEVRAQITPLAGKIDETIHRSLDLQAEANERFLGRKVEVTNIAESAALDIFAGYWKYNSRAAGTLTTLSYVYESPGFFVARRPGAHLRSEQSGFIRALVPPILFQSPELRSIQPAVKVTFIK